MNIAEVSELCKVLSDPHRLEIMKQLVDGEQCASELLKNFSISQPTLSHHMKVLSECGLISTRKEAKWSHYSQNCDQWTAFRDYIEAIRCTCSTDEKGGCCCK